MSDIKRTDPIAGDVLHVYDGIEEADNELPTWWVALFAASTVFAALYWLAAERLHVFPSVEEELLALEAEQRQRAGVVNDEDLLALARSPEKIAAGHVAFATTCAVCHGDKAEGKIGPNLTDDYWLHGAAPTNIFAAIHDGIAAKGMPAWGPMLGEAAVKQLCAYVLSIRNTHVPGKEAQGELVKGP